MVNTLLVLLTNILKSFIYIILVKIYYNSIVLLFYKEKSY